MKSISYVPSRRNFTSEHTWYRFDCRPTKARMHVTLDMYSSKELSSAEVVTVLRTMAYEIPGLDQNLFSIAVGRLLAMGKTYQAHRYIERLSDSEITNLAAILLVLGVLAVGLALIVSMMVLTA